MAVKSIVTDLCMFIVGDQGTTITVLWDSLYCNWPGSNYCELMRIPCTVLHFNFSFFTIYTVCIDLVVICIFHVSLICTSVYLLQHLILLFQHLCNFYIAFSVCVTIPLIGRVGTALCFVVPSVMFVVLLTRLKLIVWLTWCLILILFNTQFFISYMVRLV